MKNTRNIIMAALLAASLPIVGCGNAATDPSFSLGVATIPSGFTEVDVDKLVESDGDYDGTVAANGAVVQAFAERGAFVMVDLEEFKSCGLDACTDATMPIRFQRDNFEGIIPDPGELVTVLGEYRTLERGFEFDLHEVHRNGSIILTRRINPET